jgi:hypothetical protein
MDVMTPHPGKARGYKKRGAGGRQKTGGASPQRSEDQAKTVFCRCRGPAILIYMRVPRVRVVKAALFRDNSRYGII